MVSKKYMIWSIIVTLICLALGITCAVYRPDTLSYVLLGVVIFFAVLISVSVFIEIVSQNKDAKKKAAEDNEESEEVSNEEVSTEEAPVEEAPVEEAPAEEPAVEEATSEEVEETPADDKKSDEE